MRRPATHICRALLVALAVVAFAGAPAASALDAPASAAAKKKPKKAKCKKAAGSAAAKKKKKKCKKGVAPFAEIRITPEVFSFGMASFPATPVTTFTVVNRGTAPSGTPAATLLDRSTLMGMAAPTPPFSISGNTCTAAVPPGGSCAVTVKFSPLVPGVKGAAILDVTATPGGGQNSAVFGES